MSALADHLWQSTLFAIAAVLLAWVLRRSRAQHRFWLWLAASLKFLAPFSLLVAAGSHLAALFDWDSADTELYRLAGGISRPFTQPIAPGGAEILNVPLSLTSFLATLAAILTVVWVCGFATVLVAWYSRWRAVCIAKRQARPLQVGREIEVLRRLERLAGVRAPIKVLQTTGCIEPGIFGVLSPVLLWPQGFSDHLEDAHLEGILAHEVWHVRRHDNLVATLHLLVQAVFWFYPLVWWLGARLIEERERACDEKVLEWGSARAVYAESILKTCQFCAGFTRACMSSVTGADLNKRIVQVMTHQTTAALQMSQKLLLGTAAGLAVALPTAFGLLNPSESLTAALLDAQAARAARFTVPDEGGWRFLASRSEPATRAAAPCPDPRDVRLACGACRHPLQYSVSVVRFAGRTIQVLEPTIRFGDERSADERSADERSAGVSRTATSAHARASSARTAPEAAESPEG